MESWQNYERCETGHTFAPLGFREKMARGLMRREDVPYLVRGGSWDNSDIHAPRLPWTKADKEYAKGGYKKDQSASILGSGPGLDWTGTQDPMDKLKKIIPGFN